MKNGREHHPMHAILDQCSDWLPTLIVVGIWAVGAVALYQLLALFARSLGLPA